MNSELGVDITVKKDITHDCFYIEISSNDEAFRGAISLRDLKRLNENINILIEREEAKNEKFTV